MKKAVVWIAIVLALVVLASCAPGSNDLANSMDKEGITAGFWRGLWHGFIAPVTFIISLFNHNVQMYEVHNNGGWYNFGFILGAMTIFGGGGVGGAAKRKSQG